MLAKDVMSEGVTSVSADATVLEAATYLVNARVSAMPVLDEDGVMQGIVTEADLIPYARLEGASDEAASAVAISSEVRNRMVTDVMTRDVATIDANATLAEVVTLMTQKRVKRLPVHSGKCVVGIISRVDLLRVIISRAGAAESAKVSPADGTMLHSDDDELRRAVLKALRGRQGSSAERLDAVVHGGIVHLWGIVPSEDALKSYLEAARDVPKVRDVACHMQILPVVYAGRFANHARESGVKSM
jgi:CBS domain-containing protein